jgi:PKD repeat protein
VANTIYGYSVKASFLTDQSLADSNFDTGYRNSAPNAALEASPASGNPPLTVNFDASGSADPDGGSITLYEWDFDGDGTYDFNGTSPTAQHIYDKQGTITAMVRVTDDESSTATATKQISVSGWAHTWGASSNEVLRATAIDNAGVVYAIGDMDDGTQSDVLLVKYDASGALVWHKTWGDNGANDHATSLVVDFAGNIFIGGYTDSYGEGAEDMLLLKYNSSGVLLWQKVWGGSNNERAYAVAAGGTGDVFLVGYSNGFGSGNDDVVVVQFTGGGSVILQKVWDGGGNERATCAVNDASTLYIGGYTSSFGAGGEDTLLLTLDNLGNVQWQKVWGGASNDRALAIKLYGTDLYLAGSTASYGAGGSDGLLLKYDSAGVLQWQKTWGGAADDSLASLTLDTGGNVFLAGESSSVNPGNVHAAVLKLDSAGAFIYDKAWHSGATSRANSLALNFAGILVLAGQAVNSSGGVWSTPGETAADITGSTSNVTGALTNISGVMANITSTESSPTGTLDAGGGGTDSLVLKLGPS